MKSIVYIGMDVHTTNFTFCSFEPGYGQREDKFYGVTKTDPDYRNVIKYLDNLKKQKGTEYDFVCGYEAGCLGYSLYNQLTEHGIKCVILAPTTMPKEKGRKRLKNDKRDARAIAQCLANGIYSAVHVLDEEDTSVKEYLRMRDDHAAAQKRLKQQINSLLTRHGYQYSGNKWTGAHRKWLRDVELPTLMRETLNEYLLSLEQAEGKLDRLAKRIEELASGKRYTENVKKLGCFLGVKAHTALATIVETGDFKRFRKGNTYAAFLGLIPSEDSSGEVIARGPITKAGNNHLRRLLVEASQGICKGQIGHKSKDLKARQAGNTPEVIAYADKANERMRRKYYRLMTKGNKHRNTAVTAIARELACFIWGMMTDNILAV